MKLDFPKEYASDLISAINEAERIETDWYYKILLMASTLFGVLVSLLGKLSNAPLVAISISLLALGILSLSIVLQLHSNYKRKLVVLLAEELKSAQLEGRMPEPVYVQKSTFYKVCRIIAFVFLASSVIGLAASRVIIYVL